MLAIIKEELNMGIGESLIFAEIRLVEDYVKVIKKEHG